jgi:hypothetical protein
VKPKITVPRILECSSFVKNSASLQASPSENTCSNKRTSYLRAATRYYNKEEMEMRCVTQTAAQPNDLQGFNADSQTAHRIPDLS